MKFESALFTVAFLALAVLSWPEKRDAAETSDLSAQAEIGAPPLAALQTENLPAEEAEITSPLN